MAVCRCVDRKKIAKVQEEGGRRPMRMTKEKRQSKCNLSKQMYTPEKRW